MLYCVISALQNIRFKTPSSASLDKDLLESLFRKTPSFDVEKSGYDFPFIN